MDTPREHAAHPSKPGLGLPKILEAPATRLSRFPIYGRLWAPPMAGPRVHRILNLDIYEALQIAGMKDPQAKILAAAIPDWSQFATKQELESRLIRWMIGLFVDSVTVIEGLLTVLLAILNSETRDSDPDWRVTPQTMPGT